MNVSYMNKSSETNWARLDTLNDQTIDTSDISPLTETQLARMTLLMPGQADAFTVSVDPNILAWFKAQGEECEQGINAALRIYVEAHKS